MARRRQEPPEEAATESKWALNPVVSTLKLFNLINPLFQEERDQKKQEQQQRKQTAKALLEKEAEELHGKGGGGGQKMTQAEIAAHQENLRLERLKMEEKARSK